MTRWPARQPSGPDRPTPDQLSDALTGAPPEVYGSQYQHDLLRQYEMYVASAEKISDRRQSANSFFLTVNTVLVTFLGLLASPAGPAADAPAVWVVAVAAAGVTLAYTWYRLLRSYRDLNTAKFLVVHVIEQQLPLKLYDAEWDSVGRGERPDLYLPFSHVELRVPWVFAALYAALAAWRIITALS